MKKLVLVAMMVLVPFAAFALETMNDDALDEMTAQEGVTITFDNVLVTQTSSDTSWGDSDGLGTGTDTSAGYIFMDQDGYTETTITGSLEIDVATADADLTVGTETIASGTSFVKVALPSISQAANAKTNTISISNAQTAASGEALGTLWQNAGSSSVSGSLYIYAH